MRHFRWTAPALALVLVLGACGGDDGGSDEGAADKAPAAGSVSFEALTDEPCILVTADEAADIIGEGAKVSGAAPENLAVCTYTAGQSSLAAQVTQITDGTTIDDLGTFDPVPGVGDAAGWEPLEVGDAGRLVAIDGGALLSVSVTRAGQTDQELRIAASTLAKTILSRLKPIEPLEAPDTSEATPPPADDCPLIDPEVLSEAVDLELELGPAVDGACSFTSGDSRLTVGPIREGVTERDFELGLTNAGDAADQGVETTEIDGLGDRAVLQTRVVGEDNEFGQLVVLDGDRLLLVAVDRVPDAEATTTAAAEALLAA